MNEKEIRKIVAMTVEELTGRNYEKDDDNTNYQYMGGRIKKHYKEGGDKEVEKALKEVEKDQYFEIIPNYYQRNRSLTWMAVKMECDRTTIARNKKRLVLEIYRKVMEKR